MSFITDIGKNISSKGKEISQKAKIMSETSSLNNIVKGEECKVDFQYKTIGKLYFEKYKDNPGEEFAEAIENIKNSMEKIEQTKEEIVRIKSKYNCPKCGAPFKNGAIFCSKCGEKLPEKEEKQAGSVEIPADAQKCEKCGNILKSEALFCNVCGNKLQKSEENIQAIVPAEPSTAEILTSDRKSQEEIQVQPDKEIKTEVKEETQAQPVEEVKEETAAITETTETTEKPEEQKAKKICPNCKNEMLDEDVFCNECGTKFE